MDDYDRLLANPGFRLKPEWIEEAIRQWIYGNIGKVFMEFPQLCEPFVSYAEHGVGIAEVVSIKPENKGTIVKLLNAIADHHSERVTPFLVKVVKAGMVDAILEATPYVFNSDARVLEVLEFMNAGDRAKLIRRLDWFIVRRNRAPREPGRITQIVAAIPEHDLDVFIENSGPGSLLSYIRAHPYMAVFLCKAVPLAVRQRFIDACYAAFNWNRYICFKCGLCVGPKRNYKRHRRECDPFNEYPRLNMLMRAMH
jgi:hypothetical protein